MKSFYLVETITKDKLIHQGIFFKPSTPTKKALLWVHGLTSSFYSNVTALNEFATQCEEHGFGFASFNNRGHDFLTGVRKVDKRQPKGYSHGSAGAGIEEFKDSPLDIDAGVHFLVTQGFTEVVVIGHSSGANKVSYFAGSNRSKHVIGFVLIGGLADRLGPELDKEKLKKDLAHMHDLVNQGKGDVLLTDLFFFPLTPKRFISLFEANTLEDQFDYGDPRPRLTHFGKIKKPLLVLIGELDENLDRHTKKVLEVLDAHQKSLHYKSMILPNTLHSFNGKEKEVVHTIVSWVKEL